MREARASMASTDPHIKGILGKAGAAKMALTFCTLPRLAMSTVIVVVVFFYSFFLLLWWWWCFPCHCPLPLVAVNARSRCSRSRLRRLRFPTAPASSNRSTTASPPCSACRGCNDTLWMHSLGYFRSLFPRSSTQFSCPFFSGVDTVGLQDK